MVEDDLGDWSLGRLLSTAARHVERDWNAYLSGRGLTHAGLLALHTLVDGPRSQRQLAAASQVEEQTMARVVERLVRTGHVTRERDPADRRRLQVRLTEDGRAAYTAITAGGVADDLVTGPLADPDAFRAELVRLVRAARRGG
ncbi:MarR family winged helix-turn-helix transcriptional regulator [Desertihabitans aurantiacus]|uniref:MarR family winged helix-turn-helix transcriptional regulator n=1 Tax=Desertihabitans aurantiacus TaxID=2282477 RepID=UPI0018E57252|nr:MarR family transcriptional regulator [Desertihabitans aurantiacus]